MNTSAIVTCFVIIASCLSSVLSAATHPVALDGVPRYRAEVINPTLSGGLRVPHSDALLLWGTDGAIWRSENAFEWTRSATETDADLSQVAANDNGSVLIAIGQRGTILRSTDQGRHWSTIPTAVDQDLLTLVYHAVGDVWIAAGTGASILRSLDGGRSWQAAPSPFSLTFEAVASDPAEDRLLIGGEDGVIGYSRDRGESWHLTRIDMPDERTPIAAFYRLDADTVVATSAYGRVLLSHDRGDSWQLHQTGARGFFTSGTVERNGTLWLATHTGELWRWRQHRARFERVQLDLPQSGRYISAVMIDAATGAVTIAGHGGLFASKENDSSRWHQVAIPPANLETILAGVSGRTVASGEGGLIMESPDSGKHWRTSRPALNYTLREVVALPGTSTFVAVGALGTILRSTDGGAAWGNVAVRYPNTNTPPTFRALHLDHSSNALIAAGPPGTIVRSSSGGSSWQLRHWTPLEAEEAFPWLLGMADDRSVVAIEARGASYLSRDGGSSWRRRPLTTERELWHGATLRTRNVSVAAGQKGVAAITRDSGEHWRIVDTDVASDLYGSFADERTGALFLMGANGTLLRSGDSGQTWQRLAVGVPQALRRMLRLPDAAALLAFGAGGTILRSSDGIEWQAVRSGVSGELRKAIMVPGAVEVILVGEHGAAIVSRDGITWNRLPTNTRRHLRGAAMDERGHLIAVGERLVRLTRESSIATNSTGPSRLQ